MPIQWRVNPVELMKEHGYTSYRIRKKKIFGQQTYTNLCQMQPVSFDALAKICEITGKQPGELIEYVPDKKAEVPSPDAADSDAE